MLNPDELVEKNKASLREMGPGCSTAALIDSACRMLDDVHVVVHFATIAELGKRLTPYLTSHGVREVTRALREAEQAALHHMGGTTPGGA